MRKIIFSILLVSITYFGLFAQTNTTKTVNLLDELIATDSVSQKLLPNKILFTQRIFWGEKGVMRNFNSFQLTAENRQNELKVRRTMLATHQIIGFATLGGMIAQGFVGAKLYNGNYGLKDTHEILATGVNIGYFTTASLSLFAPPKMLNERKGFSSIKLHKGLAIIHLSAMIATNVLSGMIEDNPDLRPYHRAAAYTAFGSFAASMIVIKF